MLGLAVTYFLFAHRPIDIPTKEDTQLEFLELLGYMIAPRVLWISSAVSVMGISFYLFDFGNEGYKQMLLIGGSAIAIGTLVLVAFMVSGLKHIGRVIPILLRAVPLFLVDGYLLFS